MSPIPPPAVRLMRKFKLEPDPWQIEVLTSPHKRLLLNCCRQSGKSTVVAFQALAEALFHPPTRVLLVSKTHRQSCELLATIAGYYDLLDQPLKKRLSKQELLMSNHSRIVSLPCREETIRGYSNIGLLIIDEASRVPDDVYRAVRPMLATSGGRLICLSTPYGKRGFFYDCWTRHADDWQRIEIPATRCPRISDAFLAEERRAHSSAWFRQEYCCSFEAVEGLVYPDFTGAVVDRLPPHIPLAPGPRAGGSGGLPRYGGIDFGFRNPFAAVWGTLDQRGILWLTGEHYSREQCARDHARQLPRDVTWFADPSGAQDIAQFRQAGFKVRAADNSIRLGIAAVRARLEKGTLRILKDACPNLLCEAGLYHYGPEGTGDRSENPVAEHNHALDALRYLISKLDARLMARMRQPGSEKQLPPDPSASDPAPAPKLRDRWLRYDNEELWTRLF
jgi:hypothetical protein